MSYELIQDQPSAERLARILASEKSVAVDCEAAGFHRYDDRLSLVQLSTPVESYILDPIALDLAPILGPVLEDPDREVILHGADFDLRLLDRDVGIRVRGLYDTQVAASFAGESALGLSALLEKHFGVRLSKKYQRADWATRPLSSEMLDYAASDTRHLHRLAALLRNRVAELDRAHWVEEENRALEDTRWEEPEPVDPLTRVKAARSLEPRELARLRAALEWRDALARSLDRAAFRVAPDAALVALAESPPTDPQSITRTPGVPRRLPREQAGALHAALSAAEEIPESELEGYPKPPRGGGPGRLGPEEEELASALRELRNERAPSFGLDRGLLLPNHLIATIVRRAPKSVEQLREVPGMRGWQVELLGEDIVRAFR